MAAQNCNMEQENADIDNKNNPGTMSPVLHNLGVFPVNYNGKLCFIIGVNIFSAPYIPHAIGIALTFDILQRKQLPLEIKNVFTSKGLTETLESHLNL